jgi:DNA-binding transcriptional regulator YiaG
MARRTIHAARWQQWSEQEARDVLDQHSQSGLSLHAFAESIGCSVSRIQYWRSKLRAPQRAASDAFVAVHVRPSHAIKLMVDAIAIELPEDTQPERIADIIAAIAQRLRAC